MPRFAADPTLVSTAPAVAARFDAAAAGLLAYLENRARAAGPRRR